MSKIVLIGDNAVGKTSLIMKYLGREIPNKPTIGIELHNIEVQGKRIIAWDLSGQKKFFPVLNPYLKGADLYVLVFDLSRPETLESIIKWSEIVYSVAGNKAKAVLVGNKKDLSRKIDHETIERLSLIHI